jgi:hypothetical protein
MNPASPVPWSNDGLCDCSGFAAWCLKASRHTDDWWYHEWNGGWIETSAIVRDTLTEYGFFSPVEWKDAKPGHLLVYGDKDGHQGHVGIVSEVGPDGPMMVIHCSRGNDALVKDAI